MDLPAIRSRGAYALAAYGRPGAVRRVGEGEQVTRVQVLDPLPDRAESQPRPPAPDSGQTLGRFIDTWA